VNDEGFREIQLNGKQLVFLFMAATVILVVSFLFGVLVGRGVHSPETVVQTAGVEVGPDPGAAAVEPSISASPSSSQAATSSSAPAGADAGGTADLSYPKRLTEEQVAEEKLKKPSANQPSAPAPGVQEPVAAAPVAAPKPPPPAPAKPAAPAAATTKPAPAAPASTPARSGSSPIAAIDPSGPGFAVQVSIFETRQEADRLAQQLVAKGYPAFVLDPAKGAAKPFFRVRVGKYRNRQDAEEIQARLQKNEQFTPWIAR
jgi:cell division septation protein DedD